MSTPQESRFEFQKTMCENGAEQLQAHISRLDEILFKTRASGVTVWVALVGWAFSGGDKNIIAMGGVIVIGFWLLEGYFKGLQIRYLDRSRQLTELLNNKEELDRCFQMLEFPPGVVYPMNFKESEFRKLYLYLRGIVDASVGTIYLLLGFVNFMVWLVTVYLAD